MKTLTVLSTFSVLVLAMSCAGCGKSNLVPVEGVATLDGKPLAGGIVMLQRSDGPIETRFFSGETDALGKFALKSPEGSATGAAPGEYRVTITSVKLPANAGELTPLQKDRVPSKFRDGSQTFTVPDGGTTDANFAITSR